MTPRHLWAASAALALALALLAPQRAAAFVWDESQAFPRAGSTLDTAQVIPVDTPEPLDGIRGTLTNIVPLNGTPRFEVDLFRIFIHDFASFSATTVSGNSVDDTALFLFDSFGRGVYANDDTSLGLLAALSGPGPQGNGVYFLGVALGGFDAYDAAGLSLFLGGAPATGAGVLASWSTPFTSTLELPFSYDVQLTGAGIAPVPEPQALALLLAGLAVLGWRHRASLPRHND